MQSSHTEAFTDREGGFDPKIGLEMSFTTPDLISEIEKVGFARKVALKKILADFVVRWLEAALAVDLKSSFAGAHQIKEIVALDHQHGDINPYNKAFEWDTIKRPAGYGNQLVSERNFKGVEWLVDEALQDDEAEDPDTVKGGLVGRIRIVYKSKKPGAPQWHWDITLDHGCFEIQTCPTLLSEFEAFAFAIVEQHIILGALKAGLTDTSGMGGTQVNIDFETGLGNSYFMVPLVIEMTERLRAKIEGRQRAAPICVGLIGPVAFNAAYIAGPTRPSELQEAWVGLLQQMIETYAKQPDALTRTLWLNEFFKLYRFLLRRYPTEVQLEQLTDVASKHAAKKVLAVVTLEDDLEEFAPYNEEIERFQAVNVTNVLDETPGFRRVEFRDFNAVYSLEDLRIVIGHVLLILAKARTWYSDCTGKTL